MKYFKIFVAATVLMISNHSLAATPTCHSNNGSPYCQYTGKVERIYINDSNLVLIYFDNSVSLDVPASVGYSVSNGYAAAFDVDENPEFAKMFYSTALAAQASGRSITIQMRDAQSGYLKFDRIWLSSAE